MEVVIGKASLAIGAMAGDAADLFGKKKMAVTSTRSCPRLTLTPPATRRCAAHRHVAQGQRRTHTVEAVSPASAGAPEEEPPRPVRFGIVGCANIARKLSRAMLLVPDAAEIVALASRSEGKARRFAADNGLPAATRLHGSYEALLDDPNVDAVYLPLPTSLHLKWATAAAAKGNHLLLEKPTALCAAELDAILSACEASGVQFMDCTMWVHNPRTAKMRELVADQATIGDVRLINAMTSFQVNENFLRNDIRVKPDLDALGVLGDIGWYCIRAILWAVDYELPKNVIAQRNPVMNQDGVFLACGATIYWADGKIATFHCSFLANLTLDITVIGTNGTLHVNDLVIPFEEKSGQFTLASRSGFAKLESGWDPMPSKHVVTTELPQEALMVQEFSRMVQNIRDAGAKPEGKWPAISRKTQVVMDAVKTSIDKGFEPVDVAS